MPMASQFISTPAVTELRLLKLGYIYVNKLLGFDHIYVIRLSTDKPGFTWSGRIAVYAIGKKLYENFNAATAYTLYIL
jgi:hypothetical protein